MLRATCRAHRNSGSRAATAELRAMDSESSPAVRHQYDTYQDRTAWRMIYGGIEAGNGVGDVITPERARTLIAILSRPLDTSRLDDLELYDDAGICRTCGVAYCCRHWSPTDTGYGSCPEGHGKSLDPHWSRVTFSRQPKASTISTSHFSQPALPDRGHHRPSRPRSSAVHL